MRDGSWNLVTTEMFDRNGKSQLLLLKLNDLLYDGCLGMWSGNQEADTVYKLLP